MTRLRRERLSRGLTLREAAEHIGGVTYQGLSYLERGDVCEPRPGLRLRLERFFRLPIEILMTVEPEPEHGNDGPKPAAQIATTRDTTSPGTAKGGASHAS